MTRAIPLVVALAFAHGCCCPIGTRSTPEQRAERAAAREAERHAAIGRAIRRVVAYSTVRTLIDPSARVAVLPCPDPEIDAVRGAPVLLSLMIPTVDYGSLPGAPVATDAQWTWLNNAPLRPLARMYAEPGSVDDTVRERAGDITHRYLAVFVAHDRVMPRATADRWEPGRMHGGVYVVDLDASRVICSTPFVATSSADVQVDDEGILRTSLAEAIEEDFQENVEASATEALQEHTVHFNLNVVGIL